MFPKMSPATSAADLMTIFALTSVAKTPSTFTVPEMVASPFPLTRNIPGTFSVADSSAPSTSRLPWISAMP